MAKIHEMELHDEIELDRYEHVTRVPGGWIYRFSALNGEDAYSLSSTFVPFNVEFSEEDPNNNQS